MLRSSIFVFFFAVEDARGAFPEIIEKHVFCGSGRGGTFQKLAKKYGVWSGIGLSMFTF